MTRAQFQFYATAGAPAPRGGQPELRWRLIAGNHRDLGRSALDYPDAETARAAVRSLVLGLARTESRLSVAASQDKWMWDLMLDGERLATASRGYSRRVECELSVRQFTTLAADAVLNPTVKVFRAAVATSVSSTPERTGGSVGGAVGGGRRDSRGSRGLAGLRRP